MTRSAYQTDNVSAFPSPRFEMLSSLRLGNRLKVEEAIEPGWLKF
jgi:hypothetical protein